MKSFCKARKIAVFIVAIISLLLFTSGCSIQINGNTLTSNSNYDILNNVYEKKIVTASVLIKTEKRVGLFLQESQFAEGSGIIFYSEVNKGEYKSTTKYYVLSNNHVIYGAYTKNGTKPYTVIDCYGNSFTAELICCSASYDLALLSFESTTGEKYGVLNLATENAKVGDSVVSIGASLGVLNCVTVGSVTEYSKIEMKDTNEYESNITFEVMNHTAPINSGASGGAVLNGNYEIVGINYACSRTSELSKFVSSYAVPVLKVKEFLTQKGQSKFLKEDNEQF